MHLTISIVFFSKNYANLHLYFICSFISGRFFNPPEYFIFWLDSHCYASFFIQRFQVGYLHWYFHITWSYTILICSLIRSAYLVLNLWEMKFFAFWLTEISRSWNLFVKLYGTITNTQSFFKHNALISKLSWRLKVPITINEFCSFG